MKRSKWCKYCDASKQIPVCSGIMGYDRCIRKFKGIQDIAEQQLQNYRDWLAKRIRKIRKDNRNENYRQGDTALILSVESYSFKKCAAMLDPEKSARVAARVQEIKEWREQK